MNFLFWGEGDTKSVPLEKGERRNVFDTILI